MALTLNIKRDFQSKVEFVQRYQQRLANLELIPPRYVPSGPVLENVLTGDVVDVLKFPVPRHHELDVARYIGTACCVITKDPDSDWCNLGAYRCQVYDGQNIGCQIAPGKHGRQHRDAYFRQGQPMPVAIVVGQDPLLYLSASQQIPAGVSEYAYAGGIMGEPIEVVRGVYTGLPVPAAAEIVIEGEIMPGQVRDEGPYGEWMGYYNNQAMPHPYVQVKAIMYRHDPILCCAPQHKPMDETVPMKAVAGSAAVWESLRLAGIDGVKGVWRHEGGLGVRFMV